MIKKYLNIVAYELYEVLWDDLDCIDKAFVFFLHIFLITGIYIIWMANKI